METTKTFLLDLSKDKLDILDVYCGSKNITRTEFFRQLFNSWLLANASDVSEIAQEINQKVGNLMLENFKGSLEKTSNMLHALMPIPNYLDHYRGTKLYESMISNDKVEEPKEPLHNQVMDPDEREKLNSLADKMCQYGFIDESIMLKDISHWQRYLGSNPGKEKTFLEYVEWKYTNPDLVTY